MSYESNRSIPRARAIDEYQDSLASSNVRSGFDISGYVLGIPVLGLVGFYVGMAFTQFGVIDHVAALASMISSWL